MAANLQPLSLGELLDRCFQYYKKHFGLFAGIVAIPAVVIAACNLLVSAGPLWFSHALVSPLSQMFVIITSLIVVIISSVAYVIAHGAATYALSQVHLGQPISVASAYRQLKGRYTELVWLTILIGVRVFLFFIPFIIGLAIMMPNLVRFHSVVLALVGVILAFGGFVLGVYWFLPYVIAIPALVVENIRPGEAIDRCSVLAGDYRWRIFVITVLMTLITWIVTAVLLMPLGVGAFVSAAHRHSVHPMLTIVNSVFTPLARIITIPLFVIAFTLAYYDCRVRKEGLDIELMLKSADPMNVSAQNPPSEPSPAS